MVSGCVWGLLGHALVVEEIALLTARTIIEELIKYFCGGETARAAAEISGVNRNAAFLFYHKLREVIFEALDAETPALMADEIEVDESYFGGHRKGKRSGKVHVVIVPNVRSDTFIPIIRETVSNFVCGRV